MRPPLFFMSVDHGRCLHFSFLALSSTLHRAISPYVMDLRDLTIPWLQHVLRDLMLLAMQHASLHAATQRLWWLGAQNPLLILSLWLVFVPVVLFQPDSMIHHSVHLALLIKIEMVSLLEKAQVLSFWSLLNMLKPVAHIFMQN